MAGMDHSKKKLGEFSILDFGRKRGGRRAGYASEKKASPTPANRFANGK